MNGVEAEGWHFVVFVRSAEEFTGELGHIDGALNLPVDQLAHRLQELPKDRPLALVCHTDRRSRIAAKLLHAHGFRDLHIVRRGMTAWRATETSRQNMG